MCDSIPQTLTSIIRDLHLKMQFPTLQFGKPLENKEKVMHSFIMHCGDFGCQEAFCVNPCKISHNYALISLPLPPSYTQLVF